MAEFQRNGNADIEIESSLEAISLPPERISERLGKRKRTELDQNPPQSRRHIKIARDDPDDVPESPPHNTMLGEAVRPLPTTNNQAEPIEIESEEDEPPGARDTRDILNPTVDDHHHYHAPARGSVTAVTSDKAQHRPSILPESADAHLVFPIRRTLPYRKPPKQLELDNKQPLLYPDSDPDTQPSRRHDLPGKVGCKPPDGPATNRSIEVKPSNSPGSLTKSPYFAQNEAIARKAAADRQSQVELSDEETPAITFPQTKFNHVPPPSLTRGLSTRTRYKVKFGVEGYGSSEQEKHDTTHLELSDEGFTFMDSISGHVDKGVSLDYNNISNWIWVDSTNTIHVMLKEPIARMGKQVYVTLKQEENCRMIETLQKDAQMCPKVVSKYSPQVNKPRIKACEESSRKMMGYIAVTPRRKKPGTPSRVSPERHILEEIRQPSPEFPTRVFHQSASSIAKKSTSNDSSLAIYDSAIKQNRAPIAIALPKGRDQREREERNLLVDSQELLVRAPEQPQVDQVETLLDSSHFDRKPRTRGAQRSAEEKSARDAKSTEPLLIYPNIKGQNSVTLYEDDLDRLRPDEFLNDSIVEFYLRFNYDRLPEEQRTNAHVFNTFFYQRLTQKKDKSAADSGYAAVRRWTSKGKGVDLFSKRFVVIPVNENLHWYLVVIVNLDQVEFGDEVKRKPEESSIRYDGGDDEDMATLVSSRTASPQPFNTDNLLSELDKKEDEEHAAAQITLNDDGDNASAENSLKLFEYPKEILGLERIVETPSPAVVSREARAEAELVEFGAEPPIPVQGKLSLTARIRADEQRKLLVDKVGKRSEVNTADLENLTIEDSDQDRSKITTYSKKGKGKKPGKMFSKGGHHISENVPTIIILDSLGNTHTPVYAKIKNYLVAEAMDKKNQVLDVSQFATCKAELPQQTNFSDCGLFLIQYADTLLSHPEVVKNLLNKVEFDTPTSRQAHKRRFNDMFGIDRIPLRRAEMTKQIRALSGPYRERARLEEKQRKAEKKKAMLEKQASEEIGEAAATEDDPNLDNSCCVLPEDPKVSPRPQAALPDSAGNATTATFQGFAAVTVPDTSTPTISSSDVPPQITNILPPNPILPNLHDKTLNEDSVDDINML